MVCGAADASYYKMQFYPGKDAALQEGTKPTKPVNNDQNLGLFGKKFQNEIAPLIFAHFEPLVKISAKKVTPVLHP